MISARLARAAYAAWLFILLDGSACVETARSGGRGAVPAAQQPELRCLWVDGFHAGIRTRQEADQLVADAKKLNLNTLFVQVRRRGDAFYKKSMEPPVEDPAYDPEFDALDYVLGAAHRERIEVHAWINAMPIWRDLPPPRDPRHVFNQHGPSKSGDDMWLTLSPKGEARFPVGYFLDPGHPAAADYLLEIYLNVVRTYAVDGIHFDYIRYPETEERLPRGAPVGYNPASLARFRRAAGRQDTPAPDDEEWTRWRRLQVTQLVRRIYIEAKAINPRIKVSAALIPWGEPPADEDDFLNASPGQRIFQDWQSWLKEGILDLAVPMNYAREHDPTVRLWFDGWIRWEKRYKHGRQLVVGIGAYLNSPEAVLAQIARVRKPEGRNRADGISFFSYASPQMPPAAENTATGAAVDAAGVAGERLAYLVRGTLPGQGAFTAPTPGPLMTWLERPVAGWLAGRVLASGGTPVDGARITLRRAGWWPFHRTERLDTDGNGYFGFAELEPGRYRVRLEKDSAGAQEVAVEVIPGRVARVELLKK